MPESPWSIAHVAPGTTYTTRAKIDNLEQQLAVGRKGKLYPLGKSGSRLEIFGENPRVLVNQLETKPAAIWYCLYDQSLLSFLKDQDLAVEVQRIIATYFNPPMLPVVPIIRTDAAKDPKYKVMSSESRVYSVHGGANFRTFFKDNSHDSLEIDHLWHQITRKLLELQSQGIFAGQVPDKKTDLPLDVCEELLKVVLSLKSNVMSDKSELAKLEVYAKLLMAQKVFQILAVRHGHPHGGNVVVTWSKEGLSRDEFENELVNPIKISTDYSQMLDNYPQCELHPLLIDFDQADFVDRRLKGAYDDKKLFDALSDPNEMHKIAAMHMLDFSMWPKEFILSFFVGKNQKIIREFVDVLFKIYWYKGLDETTLHFLFTTLQEAGIGADNPLVKEVVSKLIPGIYEDEKNKIAWKSWLSLFANNPSLEEIKKVFFNVAFKNSQEEYQFTIDKFLSTIDSLINDK